MDIDLWFRLQFDSQLLLIRSILLLHLLFNDVVDATTKFIGTFDATVVGIVVVIGNEKAL